jgi:choline dehydrogenase-like flavoprotein
MIKTFDAIVIGAGQAGPSLAGRLTAAGMSVASLSASSSAEPASIRGAPYAAQMARRASDYGLTISGAVGVDMKRVKASKGCRLG